VTVNWALVATALVAGYLCGSIPFGLILTKLTGAGNLRDIGSGNIGATNVLRTGRKGLAAATLLLDLAKGATAVCLVRLYLPGYELWGAAGAVIGHIWPLWIGFRGGKGVATLMGVTLALSWVLGLLYAVIWLGTLAVTRISSVSGMAAAVAVPVLSSAFGDMVQAFTLLALGVLVVWKHRENIGRLIDGTEPKVGQSAS
jgi:acyl phosphate:glycerol-3-phosphate acyltransferase